jgi:regulatory protein
VPSDPEEAARSICLRLLTSQPRTRASLDAALRRQGIPGDAIEVVLARFADVGLIDDAAFAFAWVGSRHRGRGLSRNALRQELRQRGVPRDTAEEALADVDDGMEERAARSLVMRRLPSTRAADPVTRARRLTAMLARKGYSPGLAIKVVRDALASESSDVLDAAEDAAGSWSDAP